MQENRLESVKTTENRFESPMRSESRFRPDKTQENRFDPVKPSENRLDTFKAPENRFQPVRKLENRFEDMDDDIDLLDFKSPSSTSRDHCYKTFLPFYFNFVRNKLGRLASTRISILV